MRKFSFQGHAGIMSLEKKLSNWNALNDKIRPKPGEGRGKESSKSQAVEGWGGVDRRSALGRTERWRLGWCSKRIPMHCRLDRWRLKKKNHKYMK